MTEDPTAKNTESSEDNLHDEMDELLPAPVEPSVDAERADDVDGPLDEVIPPPTNDSLAPDDASTREELEVDSDGDAEDDRITIPPGGEQQSEEDETAPEQQQTSQPNFCIACGESISTAKYCPECGTEQDQSAIWASKFSRFFLWSRPLVVRVTMAVFAMVALLALLSDNGSLALMLSASLCPVLLLITISRRLEGWARNGWIQIGMMVLVGIAAGLPIAWLATRIVKRSWFEGGVLQFGATGFGGVAVQHSGAAPFLVWLIVGILIPIVVILLIAAAPAALRMALALNPRESTGLMLTSSVACGYLIGTAVVFYWPLAFELPPIMSTSQWTLTILGIAIVRPFVWIYSASMIGAVVWRYLRTASLPSVTTPGAIAIGLPFAYGLLNLAVAPAGLWAATVLGGAFAFLAAFLFSRFLETALRNDDTIVTSSKPFS